MPKSYTWIRQKPEFGRLEADANRTARGEVDYAQLAELLALNGFELSTGCRVHCAYPKPDTDPPGKATFIQSDNLLPILKSAESTTPSESTALTSSTWELFMNRR
jgi:hypothetical protein